MKLGIGIDTGGTYTDAVIYDFESQAILGTAKSRTTHNDLTIGILGAIDNLPLPLVQQAEVISLSTTLATNACVENKGGRAKLIFFGVTARFWSNTARNMGCRLLTRSACRIRSPIFPASRTGNRTGSSLSGTPKPVLMTWTVWALWR